MGWHWLTTVSVGIAATCVAAAFGIATAVAALIGLTAFGLSWGSIALWALLDAHNPFDEFD